MPSSVPDRLRDVYVIGKLGSYELPTLAKCESLITQLSQLLRSSECRNDPKLRARVEWDRDLAIDRWSELSFEFHARAAMKAATSRK
jgi:hypothetical protein